jgi:hypothetical protein
MDEPKMCVLCADRAERDRLREEVKASNETAFSWEQDNIRLRALNAELVEALKSVYKLSLDVKGFSTVTDMRIICTTALSKAEQKGE